MIARAFMHCLAARRRLLCRMLPLLALVGCGGILPVPVQPPQLYVLHSQASLPADLPRVTQQLLISAPIATGGIDTERIALSRAPNSLDYFAGAAWTDHAPAMVQDVVIEAFEASGKIVGVGRDQASLRADYVLQWELRRFEAAYPSGLGAPTVHVALLLRLVRMPDRVIVGERRIEQNLVADENTVPGVVATFGRALDAVSVELVSWTLRAMSADAASGRRAPAS
jgi:cholesterol transport system auxiliary component